MIHHQRVFGVGLRTGPVELGEKLSGGPKGMTWCCCTGFVIGRLLLLADQFSEDGPGEWAAFMIPTDGPTSEELAATGARHQLHLRQIESITFSWIETAEEATACKATTTSADSAADKSWLRWRPGWVRRPAGPSFFLDVQARIETRVAPPRARICKNTLARRGCRPYLSGMKTTTWKRTTAGYEMNTERRTVTLYREGAKWALRCDGTLVTELDRRASLDHADAAVTNYTPGA